MSRFVRIRETLLNVDRIVEISTCKDRNSDHFVKITMDIGGSKFSHEIDIYGVTLDEIEEKLKFRIPGSERF